MRPGRGTSSRCARSRDCFAGYGGIALHDAAESAPPESHGLRDRHGADRPAARPALGRSSAVWSRRSSASVARSWSRPPSTWWRCWSCSSLRRAAQPPRPPFTRSAAGALQSVLAFENFVLLMAVVFGLQLVDRSYGRYSRSMSPSSALRSTGCRSSRGSSSRRRGRRRVRQSAVRAAAANPTPRWIISGAAGSAPPAR